MVVNSNDEFTTIKLEQSNTTSLYYLNTKIGKKNEVVSLLVDTLANGTSIKYSSDISRTAVIHQNAESCVTSPLNGLQFNGLTANDKLCIY